MPVVYYEMPNPYALQIKDLQDNYNQILNELSDVNSQVAYPFLIMVGEMLNVGDKELSEIPYLERSKYLLDKLNTGAIKSANLEGDSDLRFVSWNAEPKTLMYEIDNTKDLMYKLTSTPDLSLENIKSITGISGLALQILFLDSEIAKQGDYTLFFELKRAMNLHALFLGLDLDLAAETKSFMPNEIKEIITNIALSVQNKLISQQTAVEINPLVKDVVEELSRIEAEKETMLNEPNAESFNVI